MTRRADGATNKEIAAAVGVSEATAWRTTSDLSFERSEVVNARGQTRPATYARKPEPPPTMFDPGGSAALELRQIRQMEAPHVYG